MSAAADLELTVPSHLLPKDGRFGCGPSKVPGAAVRALADASADLLGTSHRQAPVKQVVGDVRSGLAELFSLPDGYEVVLGNGGASCFWDVAVSCLIAGRSQHLVFGEFSSKFAAAAAAAPHLAAPQVIESPPGTRPSPQPSSEVDTYCLTQNETSTGVVAPVVRVGGEEQLVLVDATSAAGGLAVDVRQADAYYFSPQKCFASEGGLWIALCSPAAVSRAEDLAAGDRWIPPSLSFLQALQNSRQNQTVNTPAIATLFLLNHQVHWLLDQGGLSWAVARCRDSAQLVYEWAEARPWANPFVAEPSERSSVVATIDLDPEIPARRVSEVLRQNGIVDTDSYRKLGRNQLRLGLFPAVEPSDVAQLTRSIDWVVEHLQAPAAV